MSFTRKGRKRSKHEMCETKQGKEKMSPGGALPTMAYTGRLRPKGVPFSRFRYMKGYGFHDSKYMKG